MTAPATIAIAAAGTPVAAAAPIILVPVPVAIMVPVPVDIMVPDIVEEPEPEPSMPPTAALDDGEPTAALAAFMAKSLWDSPELSRDGQLRRVYLQGARGLTED